MKILLIDTTTKDMVVSVITENQIFDSTLTAAGTHHSELLCNAVSDCLNKANLTFAELDAYACAIGPGSFTGIRIGVSTVKGYETACSKPIIALNCLEATAFSQNLGNKGKAIIDAGNGYYFADYTQHIAPCLIPYEDSRTIDSAQSTFATQYFDGLVYLAKQKFLSNDFCTDLEPLYIRKSQAEEHK